MGETRWDGDAAYAEWYAWALREVSPDEIVCQGAAEAAVRALAAGAGRSAAEKAARESRAGQTVVLRDEVAADRRAYAEWYVWARHELGGEPARWHRAAQAALLLFESGHSAYAAAEAARVASGAPARAPEIDPALPDPTRADLFDSGEGPLPDPPARPSLMFGGLGRRSIALVLDLVLLAVPAIVSLYVIGLTPGAAENTFVFWAWVGLLLLMVWGYFSSLLSSPLQGTLGMAATGMIVTDRRGRKISFARATGRYAAMWISLLIFLVGFIMAGFTEDRRALHDMIAGTLVVRREYAPLIAQRARAAVPPASPPPYVTSAPLTATSGHRPEPVGGQAQKP